jgi:MFS family permease
MIRNQRWLRIMPVATIMYSIAFINRTNVSQALPSISRDLHLDPLQAGAIAGIFFWGYLLLQMARGRPACGVGNLCGRHGPGPQLCRALGDAFRPRSRGRRNVSRDSGSSLSLVPSQRKGARCRSVPGRRAAFYGFLIASLGLAARPLVVARDARRGRSSSTTWRTNTAWISRQGNRPAARHTSKVCSLRRRSLWP